MRPGNRDGFRFWLHFTCGAVFGAGVGLYVWLRWHRGHEIWPSLLIYMVGGALLTGLAAGFGDDDFWGSLGRGRRW